mgnify:CR=1 FL=1
MMLQIHPQARTTPVVRAEIVRSSEPTSALARRYEISDETVRKWRKRGRRSTGFGLDDMTFVVRHFLPYLNRAGCWSWRPAKTGSVWTAMVIH